MMLGETLEVTLEYNGMIDVNCWLTIRLVVSKVSVSNQKEEVVMEFTSKGIFSRSVDGLGASNEYEN
jgi:hypothetical protein